MIRIFRKVRSQLLSENRYPVYLLYASGEIILVMIGILLALQVDNWNQKRLEYQRIKIGLLSLRETMKEDRESLSSGRKLEIFRTYSLQHILDLAGQAPINYEISGEKIIPFEETIFWDGPFPEEFNRSFVDFSISWSVRHSTMSINTQVINELESTGLYSQIENQELKRLISSYYFEAEWRLSMEDDRLFTRRWDDFLIENGMVWLDVSNVTDPLDIIKNNPQASALLQRVAHEANWRATSATLLINRIDEIVQMINTEVSD